MTMDEVHKINDSKKESAALLSDIKVNYLFLINLQRYAIWTLQEYNTILVMPRILGSL